MYSRDQKMLITPSDYLVRFDEFADRDGSYVCEFILPYGPFEGNEMSDTVYKAGETVRYHQHEHGTETFLVDYGRVEVIVNDRRALIEKGDMVHIVPYLFHTYRYLDEGTIWRELFQGMRMTESMLANLHVRDYHPEL